MFFLSVMRTSKPQQKKINFLGSLRLALSQGFNNNIGWGKSVIVIVYN